MKEKKENIDWVEYWFSESRKRSAEEINAIEKEIKSDLLKSAKIYIKQNPHCKRTAKEIARERWEKEYNKFKWQIKIREEAYHESNITILFNEVFEELYNVSPLSIKSNDYREKLRGKCYSQFFARMVDHFKDSEINKSYSKIPIDDPTKMKNYICRILADIEPSLSLQYKESSTTELILPSEYRSNYAILLELIKNHIGLRIEENVLVKRSFSTIEEKAKYIEELSPKVLKGIQTEMATRILNTHIYKEKFSELSNTEIILMIDQFLTAFNSRFSIPDQVTKKELKNKKSNNKPRKNYPLLFNKILETCIIYYQKNKIFPNQKIFSKYCHCSEATVSRLFNNPINMNHFLLYAIDVQKGKNKLKNFDTLTEEQNDLLSSYYEYLLDRRKNQERFHSSVRYIGRSKQLNYNLTQSKKNANKSNVSMLIEEEQSKFDFHR